jgi:lysophospholipase L1-like esterase/phosphoserine phosphatase
MTIHDQHEDHQRDHQEPAHARDDHRDTPPSSGGIALPVAALAALTAAVIWFGLSPAPPAKPKVAANAAASAGDPACASCGSQSGAAAATTTPTSASSSVTASPLVKTDPLPSWNDGPMKQSILDFVAKVSRQGSDTFVPVAERVAVFDHDGTLVCEKPIVHGMFLIDRVRALAEQQPEIAHEEPYATLMTGDIDFVRRLGKKYFLDLMFKTLAGLPEEKLESDTRHFLATARHPVFDVPYCDVTYQPMKELIALLRSNDFSVWICSGSGVHFMRPAAEAWYGVGPEHVIASRAASELREVEGTAAGDTTAAGDAPNRRLELVVLPHLQVLNDEERKPVSIGEHIGRRPIFAAGNVGSTGDIEMLRWSQSSDRPNLQLLVLHDDDDREMAYGEPSNDSMEAAEKYGWNVVRMATDWNRIFPRPLEKKQAVPASNPSAPATSAPATSAPAPVAPAPVVPAAEPAPQAAVPPPVRWENEIAAFEKADGVQPPPSDGVVFLGSSNIRMWNTLTGDFPELNVINRGVGGANLAELAVVANRLVPAAKPRAVVVSAGSNDIAAGATAEAVRDAFALLVRNLRAELPDVKIAFLAMLPSEMRWEQKDRQQQANEAVRDFIAARVAAEGNAAGLIYIDANAAVLGPDGRPAVECFLDDKLHPSTIGNSRRAAIIRPLLYDLLP